LSPLRILLAAVAAEVAALAAALGGLYASSFVGTGDGVSGEDLFGVASITFVATLLMCGLFYAPGLALLRRRRKGCRPASHFLLASALALNLPAFLLVLVALALGKLSGFSEAALFLTTFLAAGLAFGLAFISLCRESKLDERPPSET
jgi:hypothetical protein